MTVLILAREFDRSVDSVIAHLNARDVSVFRADLSQFPSQLKLHAQMTPTGRWRGRIWNEHHEITLDEVRSIWNRNPSTYSFPDSMSRGEQDFAYREAKLGFGGILASLDVLWVNHPNRCADAIYKPYQWRVATDCGLRVADTVITNDPETARSFAHNHRRVITKGLGPSSLVEDGERKVAFTRQLDADEIKSDLSGVAVTATTLQEFVPKQHEVRLTVIGDSWFPIALHAKTNAARMDWRSDPSGLDHETVPIPQDVVHGVDQYMKRMNLALAGFDFVVTPNDEWVMLEANTGPQFGWLEAATGAAMTEALAHLLARGHM